MRPLNDPTAGDVFTGNDAVLTGTASRAFETLGRVAE
jgi:hypothetical protein